MKKILSLLSIFIYAILITANANATNWFVRADGGLRYSANRTTGDSCDGKGDAAVVVSAGPNQHCAFKEFRFLWDDGTNGSLSGGSNWGWVISGGDTIVIRGCSPAFTQSNPDSPHCRIGWDDNSGNSAGNPWCWFAPGDFGSNFGCYNPPIPSGTSGNPTIIESGAAFDGVYNLVFDTPTYTGSGAQLFGGFGDQGVLNLQGTQWVTIKDLEITTHNGACTQYGSPAWPASCQRSVPGANDFASSGILTNTTTANIVMQDIYIDGMASNAIYGPVGGPIKMTRVLMNFNVFAGWLFDNGVDNNAAGSTMDAEGVWCTGNGMLQEYPIVHTGFPALAAWDDDSNGFGDGCWSGQGKSFVRQWDAFKWIGGTCRLNVKDCGLGPEALVHNLDIEQILSDSNMGAAMKFNTDANATAKFLNNKIIGNPVRLNQIVPGASKCLSLNCGGNGAYLSDFGRGGDTFPYSTDAGSVTTIAGNTIVSYYPVIFDFQPIGGGNTSTSTINLIDNTYIGYTGTLSYYPGNGVAPGLLYDPTYTGTLTGTYSSEYGVRSGFCPGGTGNICGSDPNLLLEVAQGVWPTSGESVFDSFIANTWVPNTGSSVIGTGTNVSGLSVDFYNHTRTNPPTIGAVEPVVEPISTPTTLMLGTITEDGTIIRY